MNASLCLFEDEQVDRFYPLSETRHLTELLVGSASLCERVERTFADYTLRYAGRPHIEQSMPPASRVDRRPEGDDGVVLFLNARLLASDALRSEFSDRRPALFRTPDGDIVGATVPAADFDRLFPTGEIGEMPRFEELEHLDRREVRSARLYEWLWDLIDDTGSRIAEDALDTDRWNGLESIPDAIHVTSPTQLKVEPGVAIEPGVTIVCDDGPVLISSGATIMANSILRGPLYIGPNTTIKAGARIYGGTSIGPWCKVGGEVEDSVILGYSNKQHEGFLGHSYLGCWVNLGADTNTSDLKNNYGEISVSMKGESVATGRMFLGTLVGDHSKTAINTMLNTGTVIGICSNVFGGGFPPKEIPNFSWGGASGLVRHEVDKAVDLARQVMARRNVVLSESEEELLRYIESSGDQNL